MLRKNKWKIVGSSAVILLPALFGVIMWDVLPETMATHWGADGRADGFSAKAFAVFATPVIFLALHFVCLLFTLLDQKQKEQNPKALGMIFWMIPATSLFTSGIMYQAALGKEAKLVFLVPALLGVMFIWIGNYLPKVKQNSTLGIKISWTLQNEENWNRTHRFAGKLWVCGGLVLLLSALLPLRAMVWVMVCVTVALGFAPIAYSYIIFRRHQNAGIAYGKVPKSRVEKIASKITAVTVPIVLIGVSLLLFTGSIKVTCGETALTIEASYWEDLSVSYSEIDTMEYRGDFNAGVRTNGFGSVKLLMGTFRNDEFGFYTLYAYTDAKEYIVLTVGEKTLVIGMKQAEQTQELYETLTEKVGKR